MCYAIKYFIKGFCDLRRPPRIVLTFQKQYVSLRFLDQYFSALATNISAKTILGGGILQFPAGPKSSEPIFVGFSTASHQRGQNVAAWQEMEVQVAANTNTNTDTNTLTNSNTNKRTIFCRFLFHGESSARAECGSLAGNGGSGRRKYKYKYRYKYTYKLKYK